MENEKRVWKLSSNEIHTNRNREICLKIESEEDKNIHMETNMNELILSINIYSPFLDDLVFLSEIYARRPRSLYLSHAPEIYTYLNRSLTWHQYQSSTLFDEKWRCHTFSANLELILFPLLSTKQMPRDGIHQSHATKPDWKCSESNLKFVLKVSRKLFCKAQAR